MVGMLPTARVLTARAASLLIAGAATVTCVAGCAGTGNDPTSVVNSGFQSGDLFHYYAAGDRSTVGGVSGETLHGDQLNLASYRGKVVVVNYWSSTCFPCQAEAQAFEELSKQYAPRGVQFVGIDERDNRSSALAFETGNHITYPSIYDRTDSYVLSFPGAAPSTTPFTIVLDRNGGIAAKASDSLDYTHLRSLLNQVLREPA
jgi:thiol-disulfide isomerase/thioredoxin